MPRTVKENENDRMHKKNCPFMNPSECIITTGCPFYTIDVMQEVKNQIEKMQTYIIYLDEKYISRDEVSQIIDEKIKECLE